MVFDRSKWWYEASKDKWEYIPGMSESRLNQINNELKSMGFKCPEIREELSYRAKSRINNIVLDIEAAETNGSSEDIDKVDTVIDDLYSACDIVLDFTANNYIEQVPILEEEIRFKFTKIT